METPGAIRSSAAFSLPGNESVMTFVPGSNDIPDMSFDTTEHVLQETCDTIFGVDRAAFFDELDCTTVRLR